jgi:hypothetical protein
MTTDGSTRRDGNDRTGGKVSTREAIERLSRKEVARAYRAPRGNPEIDRSAADNSRDKLDLVMGR